MESSPYTNKILTVILVLVAVAFLGVVSKDFVVNKIADRVIEKLQKEYSPSPYGKKSIDPDKIDLDKVESKDWNQ